MIHTQINEVHEAFERFEALLVTIAGALAADRSEATTYSRCRSLLLDSAYRHVLPGFVVQCLSVFKYREFISLLDPSPAVRQEFVRSSFAECRLHHARHRPELFAPPARSLHEWTF